MKLTNSRKLVILSFLLLFPFFKTNAQCGAPFVEEDGIITIEMESVDNLVSDWEYKTHFDEFTGTSFIQWTGNDYFNTTGIGTLTYKIEVLTPGTYRFIWRNKVGAGTNTTEHNDTWLKIPDADDFFAEKEGEILHPKGNCSGDCPEGAGGNGWFKIYCGGTLEWNWATSTNDNDAFPVFAKFNSAGVYTIQVSARSHLHAIDRMVLYHTGLRNYFEATNHGNPETTCAYEAPATVPVSGITVTPSSSSLLLGSTLQMVEKVEPYNASNQNVTWSSSNESVATVDATGLVTSVSEGNTVISAATADGNYITKAYIKVSSTGSNCNLTNEGFENDQTGWTKNSGDISVSSDAAVGSKAMKLKGGTGIEQTINLAPAEGTEVTVSYYVKTIISTVNTIVGLDFKDNANNDILKISRNGQTDSYQQYLFSGIAPAGTHHLVLWAYNINGEVLVDEFCVDIGSLSNPVSDITLSESSMTLAIGQKGQLVPTIVPVDAPDKSITWTSSNPAVANVRDGIVTGNSVGTTTITVTTADGGYTATCAVTVSSAPISVTGVSINQGNQALAPGEKVTLTAEISPADATNKAVTWSSSNGSSVSVNPSTGEVTALAEGVATITVTTDDGGFVDSRTVTVSEVHVSNVNIDQGNQNLSIGQNFSFTATISPSDATNKNMSWTSSNAAIVSVNPGTGQVTAIASGVATITVTTADGGHTDSRTVTVSTINVTSVNIDQASQSILEGQTFTFSATVSPSNATDKSISWSSSNSTIASVNSSTGKVTANSAGTATITVTTTDGGLTDTRTVIVDPVDVPVTSVTIDQVGPSVEMGKSIGLTATISPSGASNKNISWTSGNTSIATVDPVTGIVSGITEGTASITVTTEDGGHTDVVTVTVTGASPSACVLQNAGFEDPTDLNHWQINTGTITTTSDAVEGSKAALLSASSGMEQSYVASIPQGQTITLTFWAKKSSTATNVLVGIDVVDGSGTELDKIIENSITTTYQEYTISFPAPQNTEKLVVWAWCTANNTEHVDNICLDVGGSSVIPVESVSLNNNTISMNETETYQLTETVMPSNATDKSVIWTSSNTAIATVNSTGLVTGVKGGDATITVTTVDGQKTDVCNVTVIKPNVPVTDVTLNKTTLTLIEGNAEQLHETVLPLDATNKIVSWSSNNPSVATVSGGLVTAVIQGTASITVTTDDGNFTETCVVTVNPASIAVTGVSLNKTSLSIVEGNSEQLYETVLPVNASNKNVTWSSDNTSAATVSNGMVNAVAPGTAIITVTTNDGSITATCEVAVTSSDVSVTSVSLNKSSIIMDEGTTEQLFEAILPSNATNKNVTWSSSNPAVATVSNGLVSAVSKGNAIITVQTVDGDYTAMCNVTVNEVLISVASVTLNKDYLQLEESETELLIATVEPSNASNRNVTWSSFDESVATVSDNGLVTAIRYGTTSVVATSNEGGKFDICELYVPAHPEKITIKEGSVNMKIGSSVKLDYEITPDAVVDQSVSWVSNDPSVASIDSDGFLKGITAGTATVTVITNDGGLQASVPVTITEKETGISPQVNGDIYFYPNPVDDFFMINNSRQNDIISINNISGKIVKAFIVESPGKAYSIDDFEPGVYMVQIIREGIIIQAGKMVKF